jgi:ribosomal protein S18 acetylase RimI-like enzyme
MKQDAKVFVNRAGEREIARFLQLCDSTFTPHLSSRVDISRYAKKIAELAERVEAWDRGVLVGFMATYCNATDRDNAFITTVSVAPESQGRGLASKLLQHSVDIARNRGFARISLEVDSRSIAALQLYRKHGFKECGETGSMVKMVLALSEDSE